MLDYMPVQASAWAERVDFMNNLITDISVVCILGLTGIALYFAIKYRRRSDNQPIAYITENHTLETVWTIVPTIICFYIFGYGYYTYHEMRNPPSNALEIYVEGHRWRWDFTYPNGKRTTNELVVPVGKPISTVMRSGDVNHSFYIPAMRVKEDVVGSIYTHLWFTPTKIGEYRIFCAEYCGLQHSGMLAKLRVVTPEEYEDYLLERSDGPELPPAELGAQLYEKKGCKACHSLDGSTIVGPSFQGLFKHGKRPLADGSEALVDENYVRESILYSNKKIAAGFQPNLMPAFEGQLTDTEVDGLIAFLKNQ